MKIIRHPFFLAIVFLALANVVLFWKFYFKGLLPFPGNLMVSYYFPWNSGGFAGFDPWTTRKGVVAMDVIRAMYPWKSLAVDQLKNWQWPLWNPYNFSGTPLLANFQSFVFFPTTLLFLFLPFLPTWIASVIFLPFLFSICWYIFFRGEKLSFWASLFGAVSAANLTYLNVWSEQLILLQSAFFLPLILWSLTRSPLLASLFLAFSIFGGHPQTIAYVFIFSLAFALFKKISLRKIILIYSLSLTLAAVQLLPSAELYLNSLRENPNLHAFIQTTTLPFQNLATTLAPDYFGNPATNNFRGRNYDNTLVFPGLVALVLALKGLRPKFYLAIAFFGLVFALSPGALIFPYLKIPILSSGYLSRNIFFFQLGIIFLAAYTLDHFPSKKNLYFSLITVFLGLIILIITSFIFPPTERLVSLKNLILPFILFIITALALLLPKIKKFTPVILIILAIVEYGYFFNKYQPFAPAKFVFPNHPVFSFLQSTGFDRYFGVDRAYIDNNFATYYHVYAPEGYDPLYIKNYGELLAYPDNPSSSDAFVNQKNEQLRNKLFDLLAVKYIIDKTDEPEKDFGPNENRFPPSEYLFIKQVDKWKYYQRKTALPRVFLASNFKIGSLEKVYDPKINLLETLILEKMPDLLPQEGSGSAQIISYEPNKVVITTTSKKQKLLFLSDNFYPGWKVFIDSKENKILKADYTFRAVAVPAGNHEVVFKYEPLSFYAGLAISLLSFIILIWLFF